jgi:hypothetical protein
MITLVMSQGQEVGERSCGICSNQVEPEERARLSLVKDNSPVCRKCAQQHAPFLVALLELARVADRIGRIQRHSTVGVPIRSLLQLALASEKCFLLSNPGEIC